MRPSILLCTDLDRTLIPNGSAPESATARARLAALLQRESIVLAYVTGRRRALVEEAIGQYRLPRPHVVIGDVGASIYEISPAGWDACAAWEDELAADWSPKIRAEVLATLEADPVLRLQDGSCLGRFKISAFAPSSAGPWLERLRARLGDELRTRLIFSYDETKDVGLLDALPLRAGKLRAVEFVRRRLDIARTRTVFAGDSGNDLEILVSSLPSVLVANATDELKHQARRDAEARGHGRWLYLARGGLRGMNGNYAAGILEGLVHFVPESDAWIP